MTERTCRRAVALLLTASTLAMSHPALAAEVLFSTDANARAEVDRRVSQAGGVSQFRLDSGAVVSFVEAADYRINADGSIDLFAGSVTVAGAPSATTLVRMPDGVEGRVGGRGSAASFSARGERARLCRGRDVALRRPGRPAPRRVERRAGDARKG